jgi:hypothetical protein
MDPKNPTTAQINLLWEKLKVSFKIEGKGE